jgi:hypothetical protein
MLCGLLGLSLAGCGAGSGSTQTYPANTPAILASSNNPTIFVVGATGTYTFVASGTPMPTLSESGALPLGLTFVNNENGTATLSGTPAAGMGGTYPIAVNAQNGSGAAATQNFNLNVNQSGAITSVNNTSMTLGVA